MTCQLFNIMELTCQKEVKIEKLNVLWEAPLRTPEAEPDQEQIEKDDGLETFLRTSDEELGKEQIEKVEVLEASLRTSDAELDQVQIEEAVVLEAALRTPDEEDSKEQIEDAEVLKRTQDAQLAQEQIEEPLEKLDGKNNDLVRDLTMKEKAKKKILSWIKNRRGRKIDFTYMNHMI
ncbi:hypothetical protein KR054_006239 [Drosophila jambulina]|nr:hypothetical protein KR054_006239 [Drosophila jambulina]